MPREVRALRAVDLSAAPTPSELARRAKIKAAMNTPRMKRLVHDWVSRSWTAERQQAQSRLIRTQMSDPEFEAKRRAAASAAQIRKRERTGIAWNGARSHPNHPAPVLPPMSRKEFNRYTYLRRMTDREAALGAVMAEREASGG